MSVKYRLVLRKDMTKGAAADAKLFYAASSSSGMCDLAGLCEIIADRSAATAGDVKLVLDGLLFVVKQSYRTGRRSSWVTWVISRQCWEVRGRLRKRSLPQIW